MIQKFHSQFIKPLRRQLMALMQRDQAAALALVRPGMPELAWFAFSFAPATAFPAVVLTPAPGITFSREAVGSQEESIRLLLTLTVVHQDPTAVVELLDDYVRAMDYLLNALPLSDFQLDLPFTVFGLGTTKTGGCTASVMDLFVMSHLYDELARTSTNKFALTGLMELLLETNET